MISWYVQGIYYNMYANLQQASDASLCTTMTDKDDLEGQCFRDSVYLYLTNDYRFYYYLTELNIQTFSLVFYEVDDWRAQERATLWQNDITVS